MKFTAATLVLATAASAASALIPAGVSSGCSTFLEKLNNDAQLQTCVNDLITDTKSFSPSQAQGKTKNDVAVTLDKICAKKCDAGVVQNYLAGFLENCGSEQQAKDELLEIYDVLYTVIPFQNALCQKDSATQKYCAVEITVPSANANATAPAGTHKQLTANVQSFISDPIGYAATHLYTVQNLKKRFLTLVGRQAAQPAAQNTLATVVKPNSDTYKKTNLPFLFLSPSWDAKSLCTPCASSVVKTYRSWIFNFAYYGQPAGIAKSPLLGGFTPLYNALNSTCSAAFMANVNGGDEAVTGAAAIRAPAASAAVLLAAGAVALIMA